MHIEQFFDVNNIEHLNAFREVRKTGSWPVGFLPEGTEFEWCWCQLLQAKMADRWLEAMLDQPNQDGID